MFAGRLLEAKRRLAALSHLQFGFRVPKIDKAEKPKSNDTTNILLFTCMLFKGDENTPISFLLTGCQCALHISLDHPDYAFLRQLVLGLEKDDAVEVRYRLPEAEVVSLTRTNRKSGWQNVRILVVDD